MATHLEAEFVKSSSKLSECPEPGLAEYAFVGRSNVGKSSLINMLTGKKALAKTSATPGKTQLINHFNISYPGKSTAPAWILVDLPGYGYAKVSKSKKSAFQKLIYPYVEKRESLACVFVLLDARHSPQKIDMEFMEGLGGKGIAFAMVFTKSDKLKPGALEKNLERYKREMLKTWEFLPERFVTSATKSEGREELIGYIEEVNKV
jgi:GTP-binding protein